MSAVPQRHVIPFSEVEQIREARSILQHEAEAILKVANRIDARFPTAIEFLRNCRGRVVVTGIGKAGLIGQKLVATFSSTGTRSQFLHPSEAIHGDLGCLGSDDIVLALSNSGESEEVCRLIPIFKRLDVTLIAMTSSEDSTLGAAADIVLPLGQLMEAGAIRLAPTASTTAMLALGDALALVLSQLKGFTREEFAVFHPGGNLGRQLTPVRAIMRQGDQIRVAPCRATIRDVLTHYSRPGRRTGAVVLVDEDERLVGLFTDSDLARLLEQHREGQIDRSIAEVMTADPITVSVDAVLSDVIDILSERKVSELPVVDERHRVLGLIDITDVIGLMPASEQDWVSRSKSC